MNLSYQKGFFFQLTPDRVLEAVDSGMKDAGWVCTGRCMALNSFENRVYDVELENTSTSDDIPSRIRRIVKFYRPGRWTSEQILEEHAFLRDLQEAEIPAIAPLDFPDGTTLKTLPGTEIYYAIFPKVGGRAPDELSQDQLLRIGRLLGRIHTVGATRQSLSRVRLNPETYGRSNLEFLLQGNWIPIDFQNRYQDLVEKICSSVETQWKDLDESRIHGDCHLGNLLWNSEGPFFLDFDDMVRGPAVQDVWMLVPGRDAESLRQREVLLEGYQEIRPFNRATLRFIEPLRALRFIHYTTWVARRWDDPAFPLAFPQFGSHQYWRSELDDLQEQYDLISAQTQF